MEWFETLIADVVDKDVASKLTEAFKGEFPKHAVPKEQYNKIADDKKALTAEVEESKKQFASTTEKLESMSKIASEHEELKEMFATTQNELTEYKSGEDTRTANIKKASEVEKALLLSGANKDALEYLVSKVDIEKVSITESGTLDGFSSQFESLKSSKPTLFAVEEHSTPEPEAHENPAPEMDADFNKAMDFILN